jgi:small-conductance mechanosensitive channel
MPRWSAFLAHDFLGNSVRDWALALAAFLVTFTLLPIVQSWVGSRRRKWGGLPIPPGVELVSRLVTRTSRVFLWAVAVYAGARFLEHPPRIERFLNIALVFIAWTQVALWGIAAVEYSLERQRESRADDPAFSGSLTILLFVARIVIFAVALLFALEFLGVNITTLVAGLGVGGIAVALAVQSVLGDLLASLSIALDKPFVVGDALRIDDFEGVVEQIGVKSVRLRSVSGEQIILANTDVLKSRVRNLGRMPERRNLFTLLIAYETPRAKLERVPQLIEQAVRADPAARFEYCIFKSFGESALQFETCCFYPYRPPAKYLAGLDAMNRRIHAAFEAEGIEFAYPARRLFVERGPAARHAAAAEVAPTAAGTPAPAASPAPAATTTAEPASAAVSAHRTPAVPAGA